KKKSIEELSFALDTIKVEPDLVNAVLVNLNTSIIREKVPLSTLLKRPEVNLNLLTALSNDIKRLINSYPLDVQEQVEITLKYKTYIEREEKLVEKISGLENFTIRPDFDYDRVKALSAEGREKLKRLRPQSIGQASRISGVSPADVSILTVYMGK
ncbi:MAG: tRNA uridine-5-carboxymethylaminomethyl(34) synthesis enzyme MnmG, partial [Cyclobacteriaceae bacterium]